ncbi:hypothetical protein BDN70DRAFT_878524, partial [Pholiota conissans]
RKNGLFKKAYELGVLCSVDVAVIIFEERPGHGLKLHQHCSTDIRDIVQRQLRHQGDRDLKGPADFSGAGGQKFDDGGDVEDGDADEDEEDMHAPATRASTKRKAGIRIGLLLMYDEYVPPGRNGAPRIPAPPMHTLHTSGASFEDGPGSSSMLPISNDRVSSLRDHGHSVQHNSNSTRGGSELYLPEQAGPPPSGRFSGSRGYDSLSAGGQGPPGGYAGHYTPMFPVGSHASPPTPSFIPVHGGKFTRGGPPHASQPQAALPSFASGGPRDAPYAPPGSRSGRFPEPGYGGPMDSYSAMRGQSGGAYTQHGQHPGAPPQQERGDMFVAFLESDERSRQQAGHRAGGGGGCLEWPTHGGPGGPPGGHAGRGRDVGRILEHAAAPLNPNPNAQDSWFDDIFMGGASRAAATAAAAGANSYPPPPPLTATAASLSATNSISSSATGSRGGSTPTSWDRGAGAGPTSRDDLNTIFGASTVASSVHNTSDTGGGTPRRLTEDVSMISVDARPSTAVSAVSAASSSGRIAPSTAGSTTASVTSSAQVAQAATEAPDAEMRDVTSATTTAAPTAAAGTEGDGEGSANDADADSDRGEHAEGEVDMDKQSQQSQDAEGDADGEQDVNVVGDAK